MKRNTALILLELVIMLLVFSLAAALCLQAFTWADIRSRESGQKDAAYVRIQNAAEVLKHHRGDFALAARDLGGRWNGESWTMHFDALWRNTSSASAFCLQVKPVAGEIRYLGTAILTVSDADGTVLAELTVSWQEVAS